MKQINLFNSTVLIAVMLLVNCLISQAAFAEVKTLSDDPTSRLSTIPYDAEFEEKLLAAGIDRISVRHAGWNETLRSWAIIKVYDLTGRKSIAGQDPMYTVLSLMYQPDLWFDAAFLPVEHPKVAEILETKGKWISPKFISDSPHTLDLQNALSEAFQRKSELDAKVKLLNSVKQTLQYNIEEPGLIESFVPEKTSPNVFRKYVVDKSAREELENEYQALREVVSQETAFRKAGEKLLMRWGLPNSFREEFYIVPDVEDGDNTWLSPTQTAGARLTSFLNPNDAKPKSLRASETDVLRKRNIELGSAAAALDLEFIKAFESSDAGNIGESVNTFLGFVEQVDLYPSENYRVVKNFYVSFKPMDVATYIYLISAIVFGLFVFFRRNPLRWAGLALLIIGFLVHTSGGAIRLYLTGMMPVSNMYESITFTAWAAVLIGVLFELIRGRGYELEGKAVFGLITSIVGFLMLMGVAQMPLHESRIHPLRAVLNSYWLNIHVTAMLISYGAFMVATLFAVTYLIKSTLLKSFGRETFIKGTTPLMSGEETELFMYRLIQVGWPILTVGVCLGAVWADTAWGRYWGWDPKETWAFITWIVYTIYLHSRMVMKYKGAVSATIALVGFIMVMITWLGVSYLPWFAGGLHTYASPM
ncbi:MAG: c-type cytochrome biogenesis protein CcsB [Sumerlaeia bacterium]